jgi:hypothetical protein
MSSMDKLDDLLRKYGVNFLTLSDEEKIEEAARIVIEGHHKYNTNISIKPYTNIYYNNNKYKELEGIETSREKERFEYIYNRKIMLTYHGHFNNGMYLDWILDLSRKKNLTLKSFESYRSKKHTHFIIIWFEQFQSRNRNIMDYKGKKPLLRYISSNQDLNKIRACMARISINIQN